MSAAVDALYEEIEKAVRLHHGSDAKFTPAKFKPSKRGLHGPGWYATPKLRLAGRVYGKNVHSFTARGKFANKDAYNKRLAAQGGIHSRARRSLKREGYVGVRDKASGNYSVWSRSTMTGHKTGSYKPAARGDGSVIPDGPRGPKARRVRKSEHIMDAVDALYAEIEKAAAPPRANMVQNRRRLAALKLRIASLRQATGYKVKKSGGDEVDKARGGPRSGMIPYGSRHQYGRAQFFEARAKRNGISLTDRQRRAKGFLAGRYRGSVKGPGGSVRRGVYKSVEPVMSEAIDNLYSEIEKAKGLIPRGGSIKLLRQTSRTGVSTKNMPQPIYARRLATRAGLSAFGSLARSSDGKRLQLKRKVKSRGGGY